MKSRPKHALTILSVAFLLAGCANEQGADPTPPNILFILVDDQRNDVLSHLGYPIVQTPTVDRLAEAGFLFENAFVTTSICAASRASILTGLYESKHNYTFGEEPIKEEFVTTSYPYLLKGSGYQTGFVGKFGVKLEQQERLLDSMFDFYELSAFNHPHFIEQPDGSQRHSAEVFGDHAVAFIQEQATETPFCLSLSFNSVHAVDGNKKPGDGHYPYPKAVAAMYEGMEMPRPQLSADSIYDQHPEFLKTSLNRERYFWRWDTPEKYQTNLQAYFRMISGYDNVMKRVLDALEQQGLAENTVVIYSADNGYYMGNRGFAGKWSHYEESLRVPFIIFDPRVSSEQAGKRISDLTLNLDIPATILDFAGVSQPPRYQGRSVIPALKGQGMGPRDHFLIEHRMRHEQLPKYVGIRDRRYVYANYYEQDPPYEYLHDLESDPMELVNLASDPSYIGLLEEMREQCLKLEANIK
ncbi:MAG: sulfatase [Bacteroidota bacterium]